MRLWHYKLIPFLPRTQLLGQWRELNSIFKKQDKHILINYVYDYSKGNLLTYTMLVINEMKKRDIKIKIWENYNNYFGNLKDYKIKNPFMDHHNSRYLLQCFYNLQEKYDRGQKDFSDDEYKKLKDFMKEEIKNGKNKNLV